MAISLPPERGATGASVGDVRSETGTLRRVLVHRPGPELERLTPANVEALLFDDVLWPDLAREEHDVLVATLRAAGVEVLHFGDLLTGALLVPAARRRAIADACGPLGEAEGKDLACHLGELPVPTLAEALVAGVGADGLALAPLPNLMYVRDSSAWLRQELVLGGCRNPVRAREAQLLALVFAHHPLFAGGRAAAAPIAGTGVEAGDLLCLGEDAVLVGIGERTSAAAARRLARRLLALGFERVLAVAIPAERASIHLDCLLTLVDHDLALLDRRLLERPAWELRAGRDRVEERVLPSLLDGIAAALGLERLRHVAVADEREQWALAANTLALEPGRVVAYGRNPRTIEALAAAGVEVLPVPGEELSRGRGGPRCLTSPLLRDPLPTA